MDAQISPIAESGVSSEERNWAMAAHLTALIAVAGFPFGHIVGPLVVYLAKGKESEFVAGHARASMNYQITVSIAAILAVIVGVAVFAAFVIFAGASSPHGDDASTSFGIGAFALWMLIISIVVAFLVVSLVFIVMGTIAAGAGRPYTYPMAIKFIH